MYHHKAVKSNLTKDPGHPGNEVDSLFAFSNAPFEPVRPYCLIRQDQTLLLRQSGVASQNILKRI